MKAAIVEFKKKAPPKMHKLDELARLSDLSIPKKWEEDLAEITRHFWRVRYPDFQAYTYTSKTKIAPTITIVQEIYLWIFKQFDQH